jgi:hypothetical protein
MSSTAGANSRIKTIVEPAALDVRVGDSVLRMLVPRTVHTTARAHEWVLAKQRWRQELLGKGLGPQCPVRMTGTGHRVSI